MATLTEFEVHVTVTLSRDATGSDHVIVTAESYTDLGTLVRQSRSIDVTGQLTANQMTTVGNVLNAVVARVKAMWSIP